MGLSIGSFLNVLIDRLPKDETIGGRSHCDYCKKQLEWIDLVPVFSFIFLGGKCRRCKKKLSFFYPLVEIITGVGFVLISYNWFPTKSGLVELVELGIFSSLVVIFFADLKYRIIPDQATAALTIFSLIFIYLQGKNLPLHLAAGIGLSAGIYLLFFLTRGRGMGFGDVKLAFPVGLLQGPVLGFIAIYMAFITGGLTALILIFTKKKSLKSKIAFGPFMIFGLALTLLFQEKIGEIFAKFFGL